MLGHGSPPSLSIGNRSEQVNTLYNNVVRLLVSVLSLIFCTYKPYEKVMLIMIWELILCLGRCCPKDLFEVIPSYSTGLISDLES